MINVASGIARGRDLSLMMMTAMALLRKHGDLSHAGLVNIRIHISLVTLDIHVN